MILALQKSTEPFVEKGRKRYSCACSVALNDDHCVIKLLCFLLLGLTSHSSSVKQCFMNLVTFLPLEMSAELLPVNFLKA